MLEDYDPVRCQELYSESGYTSSARSDTVSLPSSQNVLIISLSLSLSAV